MTLACSDSVRFKIVFTGQGIKEGVLSSSAREKDIASIMLRTNVNSNEIGNVLLVFVIR